MTKRRKRLPIALTKWLTAKFSEVERRQVEVIFMDHPKTYYECTPEEQADMDEIDLMIELHQCKERQEAIKRADKAGEGIAKFMYEGRLYKMEWISKWDPRNHSYLDPFRKNHGERYAYWSEPELE